MIKFTKVIFLYFISLILGEGLEVQDRNSDSYSEDSYRHSQSRGLNAKRKSNSLQSHSDTVVGEDRPFFTASESLEEKGQNNLKTGSQSSSSSSSSSSSPSFSDYASSSVDSFDTRRRNFFQSFSQSNSPETAMSSSSSENFSFSDSFDSFDSPISSSSSSPSSFSSLPSSSPSLSSSNSNRRRRTRGLSLPETVNRITFQPPWCPGKALASIVPIAAEPIYRWLESTQTCEEFARRFGNVYISVRNDNNRELDCDYSPDGGSVPYSVYTSLRTIGLNAPVYASYYDSNRNVTFAIATGTILKRGGVVLFVSIAKPVSELPQFC